MAANCSAQPDELGIRQALVFASAFFCSVAFSREILPESAFQTTRIGKTSVQGLIAPASRFANALQKGLYVWITNDLRTALCSNAYITASLVIMQRCHGSTFQVLEAFQIHAHRIVPPNDEQSEHDLQASVNCVLRSLRMYIDTMASLPDTFEPVLDITDGNVPFVSTNVIEDDIFNEDDPNSIVRHADKRTAIQHCIRRLKKRASFGTVETASMAIECAYCTLN